MIVSKKVEPASLRYFASAPLTGKVFATCFCSSTTMLNICIEFLAPIMVLFIGYQVTATHKPRRKSKTGPPSCHWAQCLTHKLIGDLLLPSGNLT